MELSASLGNLARGLVVWTIDSYQLDPQDLSTTTEVQIMGVRAPVPNQGDYVGGERGGVARTNMDLVALIQTEILRLYSLP